MLVMPEKKRERLSETKLLPNKFPIPLITPERRIPQSCRQEKMAKLMRRYGTLLKRLTTIGYRGRGRKRNDI